MNMNPRVQNQGAVRAFTERRGPKQESNFLGDLLPWKLPGFLDLLDETQWLPPGVGMGLDFQACQSPSLVERWPN